MKIFCFFIGHDYEYHPKVKGLYYAFQLRQMGVKGTCKRCGKITNDDFGETVL